MASEELKDCWQRIERHLREALSHQELPADARVTAFDFIDHNEFGVAFEYLVNVLVEQKLALDDRARTSLAVAAAEMQLDGNNDWLALCH